MDEMNTGNRGNLLEMNLEYAFDRIPKTVRVDWNKNG